MSNYFNWQVSQETQLEKPPKIGQDPLVYIINPERSLANIKQSDSILESKNQQFMNSASKSSNGNQLYSSWNRYSKANRKQNSKLTESEIPTEASEIKFIQLQRLITLKQATVNNLNAQNKSLNDINSQLAQALNKQQISQRQNLQKLTRYESKINDLQLKIKSLEQKLQNKNQSDLISIVQSTSRIKNADFFKQIKIYEEAITNQKQIIKSLQNQKYVQKKSFQNLQQDFKLLQTTINKLEQNNAKLGFQKKSINDQKSELQIYVSELEEKNKSFNQTLNVFQESFMNRSKLQDQLNRTIDFDKREDSKQVLKQKQNQNVLKSEIESLKNRNQELIKEITQLKIQIGKKDQFSQLKPTRKSINGLWSPKGSDHSLVRSNSFLISTEDKLSEIVFKNHFQVQRHKQACRILEIQLMNLKSQYERKSSFVEILQSRLSQQNITFQITLRNVEQTNQFQIQCLKNEIKNLKNELSEFSVANKRKNEEIREKQYLLQRWVSKKGFLIGGK